MIATDERMKEFLYKAQQLLLESARKSTIPLFHNDRPEWEKSVPELVGSGVLVELDSACYIITAAHVVQEYALKKPRNPNKTEDDYDDPSEAYLTLNNIGFYYNESYYPLQRVVFTDAAYRCNCKSKDCDLNGRKAFLRLL